MHIRRVCLKRKGKREGANVREAILGMKFMTEERSESKKKAGRRMWKNQTKQQKTKNKTRGLVVLGFF